MRRASLKMHVHELQTPVHNCLLTPASNVFGGEATNFIEADLLQGWFAQNDQDIYEI